MKRRLGIVAFASLIGVTVFGITAGTLSWFSNIAVGLGDVSGTINGTYYARGTGTKDNPFIIKHPIHLYNLAWLQYMGEYNKDQYTITDSTITAGSDGKTDQFYFKIECESGTLNMSGWTLPPIGTSENPFIGNFDGNGVTITGLTTSNKIGSSAHEITKKPVSVNTLEDAEIVGFFGVIGPIDQNYTYTSSVNAAYDFTLSGFTVASKTEKTLIGLAAGYVNGNISGISLDGRVELDCEGQTSIADITNKISDYGLVGYSTKTARSGTYAQTISNRFDSEDDAGAGDNWGGSIGIEEIFNRVATIRSNYAVTNSSYYVDRTTTYTPEGDVYSNTTSGSAVTVYEANPTTNRGSYNYKIGSYLLGNNTNLHYLSAGHYQTDKHQAYYQHSGYPIFDGTNYVTVSGRVVDNTKRLTTTTSIDEALLFNFTNGKLVTQYNGQDYYIYRNNNSNTDLRLTTNSGSAASFSKDTRGDYFRYTFNSTHYLKAENGYWNLVAIPTLRPEPPVVSEPEEVEEPTEPSTPKLDKPTIWEPASDPGANSHYYYIYSGDNYLNSSASNTTKTDSKSTNAVIWNFGATLSGSQTTGYVRNVGNSYYLHLTWDSIFGIKYNYALGTKNSPSTSNASPSWRTTITSGTSSTIRNDNQTSYYVSYNSGWKANNGSATINLYSVHQAYLDWQAYWENKAIWDPYEEALAEYNQYLEDLEDYEDYLEDKEAWDEESAAYPGQVAATYMLQNTAFVGPVDGPDLHIDESQTESRMELSGDNVTYFPLNTAADNTPASNNTGYIVGGSNYSDSKKTYDYGTIRITGMYDLSTNIQNYNRTSHTLSNVRTYRGGEKNEYIDENNPGYVRFADSKIKCENILKKHDANNDNKVFGLHFMDNSISADRLVKAKYAQFNNEKYDQQNYELPASSIDFRLKERGYINFFAGTYGQLSADSGTTVIDSFFTFHMVRRDSGGHIISIREISQIYSDGNDEHSYIFKLADDNSYTIPYSFNPLNHKIKYVIDTKRPLTSTYPDGEYTTEATKPSTYSTLVFDTAWIKGNSGYDQHYMYYFEIPTNQGEFCLGSVPNTHFGAYLVYLDIGAFGHDDDVVQAYGVTTFASSLPYPLGVDFAIVNVGDNGGESFCVYLPEEASGSLVFNIAENNIAVTDTSGIATYSYLGTKYSDSQALGKFTVSGNSPGDLVAPSAGGDRTYHVTIDASDNSRWLIDVLDHLDENGDVLSTEYPVILCDGTRMTVDDIPASLEAFLDDNIRTLTDVVKLTRNTGTNEFDATATFDDETKKVVSVSIPSEELTGITILVSDIPTGYTVSINGSSVSNSSVYPSA